MMLDVTQRCVFWTQRIRFRRQIQIKFNEIFYFSILNREILLNKTLLFIRMCDLEKKIKKKFNYNVCKKNWNY